MEKRKTLNAEKRKAIANVFQQHFEQNSKFNELTILTSSKLSFP